MPPIELTPLDTLRLTIAGTLALWLLLGGIAEWWLLWQGQQRFRLDESRRASWASSTEQIAVALAFLWLGLHLSARVAPAKAVAPAKDAVERAVSHLDLLQVLALSGGTTLLLAALLLTDKLQPAERFGFRWQPWREQLQDAWHGFRLALPPMAATMALTAPLRSSDTQNPLLTLLANQPDPLMIALIIVIAAVIAPLSEELIFRVILQGSLTTVMPPKLAIPIVAVAFAAVHGLVDGVALLPLALVLGILFHRTHSYLTVVVIHGLFNATMLTLALLTAR